MKRLLVAIALCGTIPSTSQALELAITFEDAPSPPTALLGPARTKTLIENLSNAGVEQAAFFAGGKLIEAQGNKSLVQYAKAGHMIGSQGYSGMTVDDLGGRDFVRDMKANDLLVHDLPGFQMWFRFPQLNQGSTVEARDTVREWIYHMLHGRAHVTVDTPDNQLDRLVQAGIASGRKPNPDRLRKLYVDTLLECLAHYDRMATEIVGRSPKHIIRLRENDLAALYVGDFVKAVKDSGGKIIKALDAFNDDVNGYEADVVPIKGSQIIAIAHEQGRRDVRHAAIEDPERLKQAVNRANIWE